MAIKKFRRGETTYTCQCCKKLTRNTGGDGEAVWSVPGLLRSGGHREPSDRQRSRVDAVPVRRRGPDHLRPSS